MTDQHQWRQLLEWLEENFRVQQNAQIATAAAVRSTVAAFRDAERNRQSEDNQLAQVKQALIELITHVRPRSLADVTAEELAAEVPPEIVSLARQIQYAQRTGQPLPLPPPPPGPRRETALEEREREDTSAFALHHRDGERRRLHEVVGGVVVWGATRTWKWALATSIGGGVVHLLHRLGLF